MPKWDETLWERQPGETAKAFSAFKIYRDMQGRRNMSEVARQLGIKSIGSVQLWRKKFDWDERVLAYDNYLDRLQREETVKGLKAMVQKHIKLACEMQDKALLALKNMPAEAMLPKDIKEFVRVATDLERLSRTFELEQKADSQQQGSGQNVADIITAAYQKRKERDSDVY